MNPETSQDRTPGTEDLARFACELAGAVLGIAMRDNPTYVMPGEETGAAIRTMLLEYFGFDVAEIPGYRGMADDRGWISKEQAQLLINCIDYHSAHPAVQMAIGALRDVSGLNSSRAETHDESGLEQGRQTQPEA